MITEMQERPAYVRFELRAVEDRAASMAAGHYVARDVEYALITPAGGSLVVEKRVTPELVARYAEPYQSWKEGQELPTDGTPIREFPPLSPAQVHLCLSLNLRSIEDLANAPETSLQKMGMGSPVLQEKARAYLENAAHGGRIAERVAALTVKIDALTADVAEKDSAIAALEAELSAARGGGRGPAPRGEAAAVPQAAARRRARGRGAAR